MEGTQAIWNRARRKGASGGDVGDFGEEEPEEVEGFDGLNEFFKFDGFDEVGVGAEVVGVVDVGHFAGGGEDGDGEALEAGLLANPAEDVKAIFAGRFQIKQEETRERVLLAIGKFTVAAEVGDGVLTVFDAAAGIRDLKLFEGAFDEEDIVVIVFGNQNSRRSRRHLTNLYFKKGFVQSNNSCMRAQEADWAPTDTKSALQREESG